MRKSTLTKIICLVVLCLMVLPLVMACGKSHTIYFDANGGTVEEESRKVKSGEVLGKLPTPKRDGFKFGGWFDEEDDSFSDKISQRDVVVYDMVLVAKWDKDDTIASVEFDTAGGVLAEADQIKYVKKGDGIGKLPVPTKEGFVFDCWTLEDGTTVVRQTTVVKGDNLVVVARWKPIVYCADGTENHDWGIWQEESQATCETAQIDARICKICGHTERKENKPATGHDWSAWSESFMKRTRTCYECSKVDAQDFKNVTMDALGQGNYPVIDGQGWGKNGANLVNTNIEPDNNGCFAGNGTGSITVTLDLANPTAVDVIYVKGTGSASFTVTVTYGDGTEKMLGIGSFTNSFVDSDPKSFDVEGKVITKVVIFMEHCSNGQDFWQEIALAKDINE